MKFVLHSVVAIPMGVDGTKEEKVYCLWRESLWVGETARFYRPITQPPIDIEEERALVCELPTAIKGKAERLVQYTSRLRFASSSFPRSNLSPQAVNQWSLADWTEASPAAFNPKIWPMAFFVAVLM